MSHARMYVAGSVSVVGTLKTDDATEGLLGREPKTLGLRPFECTYKGPKRGREKEPKDAGSKLSCWTVLKER